MKIYPDIKLFDGKINLNHNETISKIIISDEGRFKYQGKNIFKQRETNYPIIEYNHFKLDKNIYENEMKTLYIPYNHFMIDIRHRLYDIDSQLQFVKEFMNEQLYDMYFITNEETLNDDMIKNINAFLYKYNLC